MSEDTPKTPLPKPVPRCKALLICERVIIEAMTGNVSVIGVFRYCQVSSLPGRTSPFWVYLQLSDGIGRYDTVIEVHDLQSGAVIARAAGMGLEFPEKLHTMNIGIPVPGLIVKHAGSYDLVLYANGEVIERQKLEIVGPQIEEPPNVDPTATS